MARYCLERRLDAAVIHDLDCTAFDLGTLLGLGRIADLGEFASLRLALADIEKTHPHAVPCRKCCSVALRVVPLAPRAPVLDSMNHRRASCAGAGSDQ